jgi:sporulation protein YlmC with PRC-barrel domain
MDDDPYLMEGGNVMKRLLGTTVCSVMLVATSLVCAQQQPAPQQSTPSQQQRQQTSQGTVEFVDAQQPSDWMTSALIGRSVTNSAGESLGDINDVIIDEQGKVVAIIIGVGGFLGIGEKDIGVRYTDLQFEPVPEPPRAPPPAPAPTQQPGPDATQRPPRPEPGDRPQGAQATQSEDPKHSDTLIVLEVSKEQLEAAPAYRKLGEKEAEN